MHPEISPLIITFYKKGQNVFFGNGEESKKLQNLCTFNQIIGQTNSKMLLLSQGFPKLLEFYLEAEIYTSH